VIAAVVPQNLALLFSQKSLLNNVNFTVNFLILMLLLQCSILFLPMVAVYQCIKPWEKISMLSDLTLLYV